MTSTKMGAKIFAIAIVTSFAAAESAAAQWSAGAFGVAEYDTKQTLLLLAGVSASPKGLGVKPLLSLQAHSLGYASGSSRTNVFSVRPAAGLIDNYNGGAVYGSVGYAFTSNNIAGPVVAADHGDGLDVNAGWDYWGTGGRMGYQVLGSYNFGSKSFWGRAGATTLLSKHGASSSRIGAEVAYLSGVGYSAVQPGGVYEWHFAGGQVLGAGAGAKFIGNGGGTAAYFKGQFYIPIAH